MKRKIVCTFASLTGILSNSFIFQACNKAESADELNQMLESSISDSTDALGIPIGIPLAKQDQEYIKFLSMLSFDIINNPQIANEFINNPEAYCLKYGYTQQLNLDKGLVKLIMALGNKEIIDSINNGDVNAYINACKRNGLLEFESLNQDPYLNKLSNYMLSEYKNDSNILHINQSEKIVEKKMGAVYGAVAIVIAAVAVEAFVVIGTTTWVTHGQHAIRSRGYSSEQNHLLEVWDLKSQGKRDYVIADKINDSIVEEGLVIIRDNFPEVYEIVDKNILRNVILFNLSKNLYYE